MRTEDIAQRFANRRDFDLVDMAFVALPLYAVTIECVCCVHRRFPPMALYVLRSIAAGLTAETEIAGFLGVDAQVLQSTLQSLVEDRYLHREESSGKCSLLALGAKVAEDEKQFVPQEETHTIIFDGILRRPVLISGERLLRPSEIDRATTIEIRPYPGVPPEVEDLKLADVISVLKSQYGEDEFDRDVLALSRISRRSRVFRHALGLAYKMKSGPDVQIAYVVDGVPHNELEQVFAEKGGPRKMGFMKTLSQVGIEKAIRKHLGTDVVQLLPDESELRSRTQALSTARLDMDIAARRAESEPNEESRVQLDQARSQYEDAIRSIQIYPARPLEVYEVTSLLEDALTSAATRVLIAVAGSWEMAIDRELIRRLERVLKRGVQVRLLRFEKNAEGSVGRAPSDRLTEFLRTLGRYSNLTVASSGRRGFFFLIKDAQFAAIANRPLLGPASRTRMFHQFSGYLLQQGTLVDAYVARVTDLYWNEATGKGSS